MAYPEKSLAKLFHESPAISGKPHLRIYHGLLQPPQESPIADWVIRPVSFHTTYTPDQHLQHLALLQEQGICVPQIRIEAPAITRTDYRGFIAAQYIDGTVASSLYPLDSDQLQQYEATIDGLADYYASAKKLGGYVLHDIFSITQFIYGTPGHDSNLQPDMWLVDIEPIVTPVDSLFTPPPAEAMKSTLRMINEHLRVAE